MTEQEWVRAITHADSFEVVRLLQECGKLKGRGIAKLEQIVRHCLQLRLCELEANRGKLRAPASIGSLRDSVHTWLQRPDPVSRYYCEQIREIFGNPFRPMAFDPAWRHWHDGFLTRLARSMRSEDRFQDMPILADALMDAGCAEEEILNHLRQAEPHASGCWVLSLILEDDGEAS